MNKNSVYTTKRNTATGRLVLGSKSTYKMSDGPMNKCPNV